MSIPPPPLCHVLPSHIPVVCLGLNPSSTDLPRFYHAMYLHAPIQCLVLQATSTAPHTPSAPQQLQAPNVTIMSDWPILVVSCTSFDSNCQFTASLTVSDQNQRVLMLHSTMPPPLMEPPMMEPPLLVEPAPAIINLPSDEESDDEAYRNMNFPSTTGYQPPSRCWAPARPRHPDDEELDSQVMPFSENTTRRLFN